VALGQAEWLVFRIGGTEFPQFVHTDFDIAVQLIQSARRTLTMVTGNARCLSDFGRIPTRKSLKTSSAHQLSAACFYRDTDNAQQSS
jgi:hypothetical protein